MSSSSLNNLQSSVNSLSSSNRSRSSSVASTASSRAMRRPSSRRAMSAVSSRAAMSAVSSRARTPDPLMRAAVAVLNASERGPVAYVAKRRDLERMFDRIASMLPGATASREFQDLLRTVARWDAGVCAKYRRSTSVCRTLRRMRPLTVFPYYNA